MLLAIVIVIMPFTAGCAEKVATPTPTPAPAITPKPTPAPTPTATPKPAPSTAKPGKVITWKWFEQLAPGTTWNTRPDVMKELLGKIKSATGGRLSIRVLYLGEHPYKPPDLLHAVETGAADMVTTGPHAAGIEPALGVLTAFPFLVPRGNADLDKKINLQLKAEGVYDKIYGRHNAKPLIFTRYGGQQIFMKDTFVTGPDSLKGKKVRVPAPPAARLIKLMNGTPVSITWGEIDTALATGLIDGISSSISAEYASGHLEKCPYITWLNYGYATMHVVANKHSLAELPPDIREALFKVCQELQDWYMDGEIIQNYKDLEESLFTIGTRVRSLPKEYYEQLRSQAYEKIWKPDIERAGAEGRAIFDEMVKIIKAAGYSVPGYTPR